VCVLNPGGLQLRQASTTRRSWASCGSPPRRLNRIYTQCFYLLGGGRGDHGFDAPPSASLHVVFCLLFVTMVCISARDLAVGSSSRSVYLYLAFFRC
jgi:hypothetical protein